MFDKSPRPFRCQSGLNINGAGSEVKTAKCCTSRQVNRGLKSFEMVKNFELSSSSMKNPYLASKPRATIPAANGAEADVPV